MLSPLFSGDDPFSGGAVGHVSQKFMAKEESTAFPALRKSQTCPTAPPKSPPRLRCFRAGRCPGLSCCPRRASTPQAEGRQNRHHAPRRITQRGSSQPVLPPHATAKDAHTSSRAIATDSSLSRRHLCPLPLGHVSLQPTATPKPCTSLQRDHHCVDQHQSH